MQDHESTGQGIDDENTQTKDIEAPAFHQKNIEISYLISSYSF